MALKSYKVYYRRMEDGRLCVAPLVNEKDAAVRDDAWNTLVQCLKLMDVQRDDRLHWDRDRWDEYRWG